MIRGAAYVGNADFGDLLGRNMQGADGDQNRAKSYESQPSKHDFQPNMFEVLIRILAKKSVKP